MELHFVKYIHYFFKNLIDMYGFVVKNGTSEIRQ